ncbi:MAG: (2Fe-2S)-binding protein [Alphaproteobacteria bacterium]|nr:(2Fe-2S)-binding protein [Alphaproteobacteria bacterium]
MRHYLLLDRATGERRAWVAAPPGMTVYEACERAGQPLPTTCRGSTICGLCHVDVLEGGASLPPVQADEAELLARQAPDRPRARLGCRITLPEGLERLVLGVS